MDFLTSHRRHQERLLLDPGRYGGSPGLWNAPQRRNVPA